MNRTTVDASALQNTPVERLREAGTLRTASSLVVPDGSGTRYVNRLGVEAPEWTAAT